MQPCGLPLPVSEVDNLAYVQGGYIERIRLPGRRDATLKLESACGTLVHAWRISSRSGCRSRSTMRVSGLL